MFDTICAMPGGVTIESVLKPGCTWRGRDASGLRVVLKKLPDDCLRGGRLHPAIRLRLTRLREAPMAGLANVIGVETTELGVVVISEFIRGRSMDGLTLEARATLLPEAHRLVHALHGVGLVHGAIGPGNFVTARDGRLRLIDPSPLLYDDPQVDLDALARLGPGDPSVCGDVASGGGHRASIAGAAALAAGAAAAAAGWAFHVAGCW